MGRVYSDLNASGIRLLDARCSLAEQALPLGVFGQLLLPTEHAGRAEALLDTAWEGPAAVRALNGLCRLILDL